MALGALAAAGCGAQDGKGPLDEVDAIVFIERASRMDGLGDIFQYESYVPGARLLKLSPPTADGEVTELCCSGLSEYEAVDIIDFDLSFDERSIVFSARLSEDQRYGLFLLDLESGRVDQLPTDPDADFVYPTFLPGSRVLFATNAVVEEGAPQFDDEYERRTTLQLGSISADGSDLQLYSRNLSHRITSTVMHTGEVLFTQWDHLNELNAGQLLRMNPDGTRVREAFGKEGTGITNSYYKAIEAAPGRVIAIGSARDRTFQSGAILDIRLGDTHTVDGELWADKDMSEKTASARILTAQVPLDNEASFQSVGRYYNAYPLNSKEYPDLLVSWADGPVQSDVNGAAGVAPDFGLYLFDSKSGTRKPIYDKRGTWEINPIPLSGDRRAPPEIPPAGSNGISDEAVLIGAMNVYETSLGDFEDGAVYGVRVVEGFSGEEGVGADFGLTEADGAATLGIARVRDDGSWAALVPANVPIHQIAIDKYGIGLRNETVWITGRAGESRFCGGCHESRTSTTVIQPGVTDAIAIGADDLLSDVGRFDRITADPSSPVGIPWDEALQPIFDAKCAMSGCHDGTPGDANKSFTITDPDSGQSQTFTFDLRGGEVDFAFGEAMLSGYSRSHLSLLGPAMLRLEEFDLEVTGEMPTYVLPEDARNSLLIQKLNPPRQFPEADLADRVFGGADGHSEEMGFPLTPQEHRLLIEMVDNGGQFYSRENAPGLTY